MAQSFVFNLFALQVDASGQKVSCERCGSFDHLAGVCKFQDAATVQGTSKVKVSLNRLQKIQFFAKLLNIVFELSYKGGGSGTNSFEAWTNPNSV